MKKLNKKIIIILLAITILMVLASITALNLIKGTSSLTIKEETEEIKFSYKVNFCEENKFKITVKIVDDNGIDVVELPDGYTVKANGKTQVGVDYEVEDKVDYVFKATNMRGNEKTDTVNFVKPKVPVINDTFALLTLSGVNIPKIEIKYDEREDFENYYSIDNGENWNLYTEPIDMATKIIAKSQNKKYPEIFTTFEYNNKTIGEKAFDNDDSTYEVLNTYPNASRFYVKLADETIEKFMAITVSNIYYSLHGDGTIISFLNDNFETIQTIKHLSNGGEGYNDFIQVPDNSKYIEFYISRYGGPVTVNEIKIFSKNATKNLLPVFDSTSNTKDGVTISASDGYSAAYYAVDGNMGSCWSTANGNYNPHWFQVEFESPKIVKDYWLYGAHSWGALYKFYIQASENGNEWFSLEGNIIHNSINVYSPGQWYINTNNEKPYRYYRIYFPQGGWTWGSSGGGAIYELKLFGE